MQDLRGITDNGPQFISRGFNEFIRISGMTHVKTSAYYPQSNGKIERYHRTIKGDCIRAKSMTSVDSGENAINQNAGILKISEQISDRYPFTINADQTEIHFTLNQNIPFH